MPKTDVTILDEKAIAEIEARANAATIGPWHTAKRRAALIIAEDKARVADCHVGIGMAVDEAQINAEFIAHAREDVPALCQTVRQLMEENRRLNGWLDGLQKTLLEWTSEVDRLRSSGVGLVSVAMTSIKARDDFRLHAVQLCRDKAGEYEPKHPEAAHALRAVAGKLEQLK